MAICLQIDKWYQDSISTENNLLTIVFFLNNSKSKQINFKQTYRAHSYRFPYLTRGDKVPVNTGNEEDHYTS